MPFGEEEYYRKEIYAENTGTVPCYVRFFLDFSEASARDGAKLSRDGENYWDYASFQGIDSADWLVEDGWFYYRRALAPGERTGWLLKSVILPAELKGQKVTLLVYEESAHALNGAPEDCRRAFGKED